MMTVNFKYYKSYVVQIVFLVIASISPLSYAEMQSQTAFTPPVLLQNAIKAGNIEDVRNLLDNKAVDINQPLQEGILPLHIAVINNQETIAALLIQSGAKVDATDSATQATPLHLAALYGRESLAALLIQKGANVNALMKFDISPLLVAAQFNQSQLVQLLLDKHANIDHADQEGFTALHFAAQNGDEVIAHLLIEHGANVNLKDKPNKATPLKIALDNHHPQVAKLLEAHRTK